MELRHEARRTGKLSSFLKGELSMSSGLINRLKWGGGLLVNGSPARTNYLVQPGDIIMVLLDEEAPEYPPEEIPLSIIYEDEQLLVVDKPSGMLIHPSRHRNTGTLANGVWGYYQKTGQHSAFHPVTRLDRDTFGLVLLAKNSHIHQLLCAAQEAGKVTKTYHGLVFSQMPQEEGAIDLPIARLPKPSLLRCVDPAGQRSITEYRCIARGEDRSLLELHPVTGRTHQLRVHCAALGCPMLGDPQYGSPQSLTLSRSLGLETQQLCAVSLRFPHPITGEPLELHSKMEVFQDGLEPWPKERAQRD